MDDYDNQDYVDDLERYLDALNDRFEKNRSDMLDAIKAMDVTPREDITSARGCQRGDRPAGGNTVKLNINKSLKPETLLATHNLTEFKQWARQFKAYYRSSNMEILEIPDQQIYLQSCVEAKLFSRIYICLLYTSPSPRDRG